MSEEIKKQLDRIEKYTLLSAKTMLTMDDVVSLTGLSKSHLYKLTSRGEIPHYKPNGKQVYFDKNEVEDWLRQNRVTTDTEIETAVDNYLMKRRDIITE